MVDVDRAELVGLAVWALSFLAFAYGAALLITGGLQDLHPMVYLVADGFLGFTVAAYLLARYQLKQMAGLVE